MNNEEINNFIKEVKNSLQKMVVVTNTDTAKLIGERNKLLRKSIEIIEFLQKEKLNTLPFPTIEIPESLFQTSTKR